jgi:hypothetical protein
LECRGVWDGVFAMRDETSLRFVRVVGGVGRVAGRVGLRVA